MMIKCINNIAERGRKMTGETFDNLLKWVMEKDSRTIEVKADRVFIGNRSITAFVYDYEFGLGQFVASVEEIDLKQAAKNRYEESVKRYEEVMDRL
jgi:3-hydroxyacyl-CoA dehydrogenase